MFQAPQGGVRAAVTFTTTKGFSSMTFLISAQIRYGASGSAILSSGFQESRSLAQKRSSGLLLRRVSSGATVLEGLH